jgi:hypothetical protein
MKPKPPSLPRRLAWLATALCALAVPSTVAAGTLSRATLVNDGAPVLLEEVQLADGRLERRFTRDSSVLYRTVLAVRNDGFELQVAEGHPSQLGRFTVRQGQIAVQGAQGEALWAEALSKPLCLPELAAEFVRAHWAQLARGAAPLACVTPIIKAKKLAPVQWVRLADQADGARVVELQPGSFGMRFFLSPTRYTFSSDGNRLLAQEGQFESPPATSGRARYLKGKATFTQSRVAADWPAARFAPAPGGTGRE